MSPGAPPIDPSLAHELERLRSRVADLEAREAALRESETQLRRRLSALTAPLEDAEPPRLQDLVDIEQIQALQDAFAEATGVASIITDVRGVPITRPSRFCRLCLEVIRGTPIGLANCMASDAELGCQADGPTVRPCLSGGLLDAGASISIGDRHVANWLIGQVIDEACNPQRLLDYASEIGADRDDFQAALARVTRMPRQRFESVGRALFLFAKAISGLAYHNHQQARHIAERERSERALKESEERFRVAFQTSPDSISISRLADGVFIAVNEGFTKVTGWSEDEALRRSALDLRLWNDPADRPAFASTLEKDGYVQDYEALWRRKDGQVFPGLTSARLIRLRGQQYLLSATRDLSEWKRAEEERDRLKSRLHEAAKMEAIGQLAGGIAHDFNNLLTVVLSGAEALKHERAMGLPPDPEVVGEIAAAGDRAKELTRQLLAFARRQVMAPVPLDLNALLRRSETLLRRVVGEDIELLVALEPDLWPVSCDPGQVEQVILNLALNARDAMPSGGKLVLSTANAEVDASFIAGRPWMKPGAYARLAIRDSGQGMSREVKAHLFEPFFTTKPVGKGTGLGLATAYGIARQNGAYILVDSEPGQGTAVELFFPRITVRPVEATPLSPSRAATGGAETVLVVEDEQHVRDVTVRCLRSAGYRVLVARAGDEAVEIAAREVGRLRLLLTDVVMPGIDGRALADELRRDHGGLRVLYVSGHGEDIVAKRGVLEPGVEFLPKPFTSSSLLARVRAVLDQE